MASGEADRIEGRLASLEPMEQAHLEIGLTMTQAYGDAVYGMDLLAYGALNRSKAHIAGFKQLIRSRNMICAGALLRLQLDTALRFAAAWLAKNPHEFATAVLGGAKVSDLRDVSGKHMTDGYLVSRLGKEYEWVPRVYKRTSGYVHFSSVHVLSAVSKTDAKTRMIELKISEVDSALLPDEIYLEAIDAFQAATEILLRYVHGWAFTKANPDIKSRKQEKREDSKPDA